MMTEVHNFVFSNQGILLTRSYFSIDHTDYKKLVAELDCLLSYSFPSFYPLSLL